MKPMTPIQQEQINVRLLYNFVCKSENVNRVNLKFAKVGKGGGVCKFIPNTRIVSGIEMDLTQTSFGAAYVLLHEVAHQLEISENMNATHNAKFEKRFKDLLKKYENCDIASRLIF